MMFGSFIRVFFRNFVRHKLFALINVCSLAVGLACCLVIALFVQYELSYDRQYASAKDVVLVDQISPGRPPVVLANHFTSTLLADQLRAEFPELPAVGRYVPTGAPIQLASETAEAPEALLRFADADFLRIFDFVWLEGSPQTALRGADEIVLTRALAEKYFDSTNVVGRTLTLDATTTLHVTGVVEKLPGATTLDFSALMSLDVHAGLMRKRGLNLDSWYTAMHHTFVLLGGDMDKATLEDALPAFVEGHIPANREGKLSTLELLPLTGLYLNKGSSVVDNRDRVLICVAIAVSILLVAIVNFMNLSTSRASMRSVEVGLRLALGSARGQLIRHFLGEAVLMTTLAMLLAVVLTEILTPFVNRLLGLDLDLSALPLAALVPVLSLMTLVVGLLAGFYPAFYLTQAQPSRVLHGDLSRGRAGLGLRASLVVCQFTVSIALIVGAWAMFSQLSFLRELNLGFTPDSKVLIALPDEERFDIASRWSSLREHLLRVPGVNSVSYALDSPLMNVQFVSAITLPGAERVEIELVPMAREYLPQYGIDLVAGRYATDESADEVPVQETASGLVPQGAFVLNETAVRMLGMTPQGVVGQSFSTPLGTQTALNGTVVGVVEDTVRSAFSAARPTLYYVPEEIEFFFVNGTLTLDVELATLAAFNAGIAPAWKAYFPNAPLQLRYLNEVVQGLYATERQQMQAIGYAALVAVLIACFGLLGLAAFNAEQRRKEIGIRKVVGGSVWRIVLLLTNDFSRLVLIANVIAWPLAYVAMARWLETFSYRIDLGPLIFVGSGLIALCIAWVTVGGTAAKAASQKPVLALRYE